LSWLGGFPGESRAANRSGRWRERRAGTGSGAPPGLRRRAELGAQMRKIEAFFPRQSGLAVLVLLYQQF
jgi:hypothetical protein